MAPSLHAPRRIADKIILLVLLLETLSISLWGGLTYVAARDELLSAINSRLQEAGLRTRAEIGDFFNPVLTRAITIKEAAEVLSLGGRQQRKLFSHLQQSRQELEELSVLDEEGRLIFRVGGIQPVAPEDVGTVVGYAPLVNEARQGRIATSGIAFTEGREPQVRLAMPLSGDKGDNKGVLFMLVNLKWLWNVVTAQEVGRSGYVYVLDERLRLIAHRDAKQVLAQTQIRQSTVPESLFLNGGAGSLQVYLNLQGEKVAGLALFDPKLKWWTVVELPVAEGLAPLNRIVWRFLAALALAIILTVALVMFFSRRLMRPLESLEIAALRLAETDTGVRVPVPRNSELTGLATAFNYMADSLADTIEQLSRQQERAEVTLHSISDGVITTDALGNVREMNLTAETLTGWSAELARGKPLADIYRIRREGSANLVEPPVMRVLSGERIDGFTNHTELVSADESIHAIEERAAPIYDRAHRVIGVVLVFRDVTENRELARQMAYLAGHDPLTGLANRRTFEDRLRHLITHAQGGGLHALLYLDLDQFKLINDTCGHTSGDEVLKQLPVLWAAKLGTHTTIARIGGDEFCILLENCQSLGEAVSLAESLRCITTEYRFICSGRTFMLGASIGIAMIDATASDGASLLAAADTACLTAKEQGRNRVWVYELSNAEVARQVNERGWVHRVRDALDQGRFELYYQDIVPISQLGKIIPPHIEILVRMRTETGGMELPGNFIPTAEHYGLMPELDRLVIKKSMAWLASRKESIICSINLSGISLSDEGLLDFIRQQFDKSGAKPEHICFEITETAAIAQLSRADRLIAELKRLGCQFSLDDFGSGLSSFRYLKHLPVDYLKIDGSFVRDMARDHTDRAMVESIHHLGHRLDIHTVAEFVEQDAVIDLLLDIGVDFAQGYAISKPAPLEVYAPRQFGF